MSVADVTQSTADVQLALPTAQVRRKVPWAVRRRRFFFSVANYSLVIAAALMFLLPFVFIVLTSLMSDQQSLSAKL